MTQPASKPAAGSAWKWVLLLAIVASLVVAAKYFHAQDLLKSALEWVRGLGAWGPAIFIALYVLACVFLMPGSLLTLGGGAIYGFVYGSLYVSIAATLGATAAFLVGRYFARGWVAKRIEGNATFAAIDKAVADEGWRIVLLTRLTPIFPFALLNYGFGVTRVSLRDYFFASALGMIPGTVMYVYFGSLIGDLAKLDQGVKSPPLVKWIIGVLIVVTTVYLIRVARKALAQKISAHAPKA